MNLIRLTFTMHHGRCISRLATSAQNIDDVIARYLERTPGAVYACASVEQFNIEPGRAFWVYQAQHIDFVGAVVRRRGGGWHNPPRASATA